MSITHLEVRRHPAWRDEVTAAAQESRSRPVIVLRHPRLVALGLGALLLVAALAAVALMLR
ncbi:MAG TPA: hypothetical protein VLE53_05710 [Gemmatimonadaceae bacterium]|nr:hypothetical protein [Gemmatimonadaceae bacterium]